MADHLRLSWVDDADETEETRKKMMMKRRYRFMRDQETSRDGHDRDQI